MSRRLVWLPKSAWFSMHDLATKAWPSETGGVMCGYVARGNDVVVELLSNAGPQAEHTPGRYVPDYEFDIEFVAKAYGDSGRSTTYLGDWHTHPGGAPTPSLTDRRALWRVARCQEARQAFPVSLILGVVEDAWDLRAYELSGSAQWYWPWPSLSQADIRLY